MADLQVQKTRGQREAHELRERLKELEERETELLKEVEALQSAAKVAELKLYRCLEEERGKWEVREGRLIEQMELIKGAHKPGTHSDSTSLGAGARDS